jgi:hypothetical protein
MHLLYNETSQLTLKKLWKCSKPWTMYVFHNDDLAFKDWTPLL